MHHISKWGPPFSIQQNRTHTSDFEADLFLSLNWISRRVPRLPRARHTIKEDINESVERQKVYSQHTLLAALLLPRFQPRTVLVSSPNNARQCLLLR